MAGVSDQTKLHRFTTRLDGKPFTILTPRPSQSSNFATNYFHETWHIISDVSGARFLSEVFWWLSYHRAENTVVVIDEAKLAPSPFDADPSSPIAVFNTDTTHLSRAATGELRNIIRRKPKSEGTVKVSNHSFTELAKPTNFDLVNHWEKRERQFHLTDRVNGIIRVAANRERLRWWSQWVYGLGNRWYRGSDHRYLEGNRWEHPQGEVQIFRSFTAMVNDALKLRATMFPDSMHRQLNDDERRLLYEALPDDHADR